MRYDYTADYKPYGPGLAIVEVPTNAGDTENHEELPIEGLAALRAETPKAS